MNSLEIVCRKKDIEELTRLMADYGITARKSDAHHFNNLPIDQVVILLHSVPWKELGEFILAWKGINAGRQIIFKAVDNKAINIDLNVADCIKAYKKIPKEHNQGVMSFIDEEQK